jgi:hypothetical protein
MVPGRHGPSRAAQAKKNVGFSPADQFAALYKHVRDPDVLSNLC